MKSSILWGLVGLNAVLLFLFAGSFNRLNAAHAQLRRPSDYLLVPGQLSGDTNSIVYIIDSTNDRLGAMSYDDSTHRLQTMPPIDLDAIYNAARGAVRR